MGTDKIKVAFIVHNASTWASLHTIYTRMARPDSGFLPKSLYHPLRPRQQEGVMVARKKRPPA